MPKGTGIENKTEEEGKKVVKNKAVYSRKNKLKK